MNRLSNTTSPDLNGIAARGKLLLSLDSAMGGCGDYNKGSILSPKSTTYTVKDFIKPVDKYLPTSNLEEFDLIIDTRPFNNYSESHLKNAVNICIPTTLIKRNSMTVHALLNLANIPQNCKELIVEKLNIKNPKPSDKINLLFYDTKSTSDAISLTLFQTMGKFLNFDRYFNIAFLDGGFVGVCNQQGTSSQLSPVIESTNSDNGGCSTLPDSPSSLFSPTCLADFNDYADSGLSGFILPSATNNNTKFVNDIKKNSVLPKKQEVCNYKHDFRLPKTIDSLSQVDNIPNLPIWLKAVLQNKCNDSIISYMNDQFNKIELLEESRLGSLYSKDGKRTPNSRKSLKPFDMRHSATSPTICSPSGLCPDCDEINYEIPRGIEFGFKNRYKNIWPYEHSRVKLTCESCNPKESDDYFNANFVNPEPIISTKFRYIATQNPLVDTINDFWKTVNTQNIKIIVNLDSSKMNYLDDTNTDENPFICKVETLVSDDSLIIRRINYEIYHFQYLKWPDFGVPENFDSVLQLIKFKNEIYNSLEEKEKYNTILVHCLAGCGRTGVFIALDSLIDCLNVDRKLIMESKSDLIYQLIQHQRTQRLSMVQNLQQYIVVYEIFLHYLANANQASEQIPNQLHDQVQDHISNEKKADEQNGFF